MKILLAGQAFYRSDNGQAAFTVRLAEGLHKQGHDVLVLAPSEKGWSGYCYEKSGVLVQTVPAVHLPANTNITTPAKQRLRRILTAFDPDIIHLQDHYFLCRNLFQVAQTQNRPVVGTNHFLPRNLTANMPLPRWAQPSVDRWLWSHMKDLFTQLRAATTPTQTAVDILHQQQIDIPLQAISCGVNTERFRPRPANDHAALRRQYNLPENGPLFCYIGRVDREKRLHILVEALARLGRTDIHIAIGGKGSYLNGLRQKIDDHQLEQNVHCLGFVPEDDLPALLNSADAFAMPSNAELQSIATLEAMASGLPVLAADALALPELVGHKENGYLFATDDADEAAEGLAYLADHARERTEMGRIGREKAGRHSIGKTVAAYARWYTKYGRTAQVRLSSAANLSMLNR